MNAYSVNISGKMISFPREIKRVIDFDNTIVVQTKSNPGETNEDWFKIDSIFGVSKTAGEIVWRRPGFEISKVKKNSKIILLNIKNALPVKYELLIYCVSMNFYVDPDTGKTLRAEQTK